MYKRQDKISVTSLSAISATLGTVSAGTISGTRLKVGGGTDEDIYFEDSGIRLYDVKTALGFPAVKFSYPEYSDFRIRLAGTFTGLYCSGNLVIYGENEHVNIALSDYDYYFYNDGVFKFPVLTATPSAHPGGVNVTDEGGDTRISFYVKSWQHCQDSSGW